MAGLSVWRSYSSDSQYSFLIIFLRNEPIIITISLLIIYPQRRTAKKDIPKAHSKNMYAEGPGPESTADALVKVINFA